jgi:hypothetical protein
MFTMAMYDRRVVAIDETSLELAPLARQMERGRLLLLTPVGGMQRYDRTPMNLACCHPDDSLSWILPVDGKRLTRAITDDDTAALFKRLWEALDEAIAQSQGPGTFWEALTPVGRRPPGVAYWVEYEKPRPWLELAQLEGDLRLLVACTASSLKRKGSRLQFDVPGGAITPTPDARLLLPIDTTLELAHFAVLAPEMETGWMVAGNLDQSCLADACGAFRQFPQRGLDEVVLCHG